MFARNNRSGKAYRNMKMREGCRQGVKGGAACRHTWIRLASCWLALVGSGQLPDNGTDPAEHPCLCSDQRRYVPAPKICISKRSRRPWPEATEPDHSRL